MDELTLRKAVEFAVKTEELGALFYAKLAGRFESNKELREIFAVLAKDEQLHEKQFKKLLEDVPPDEHISSMDERYQYLKAMSISEFFMGPSGLYRDYEQLKTREDVLARALGLEQATLGYYQALRDYLPENSVLESIIAAEKRHVVSVMRLLVTGGKIRSLEDKFEG